MRIIFFEFELAIFDDDIVGCQGFQTFIIRGSGFCGNSDAFIAILEKLDARAKYWGCQTSVWTRPKGIANINLLGHWLVS